MIGNFLKTRLKVYFAFYICINVAGCATPAAWNYAEKKSNEPPIYRSLTDVYFAALRSPDQLRLCVLVRASSSEEPSPATLYIDLEKISESLASRGETKHDTTSRALNSIGVGSKLRNKCEPALQDGEESVSIERIQVEGTDLTGALQQLAPEELTVFVLEQNNQSHLGQNYQSHIVIGSTDQDFTGLKNEAFSAHAAANASKAGDALVPFAVVADAVIVVGAVFVCFIAILAGGHACGGRM